MRLTVRTLLFIILLELIFVLAKVHAFGQTASVQPTHNTISIPYDGQGVPVHLSWNPIVPPAGWSLIDYCVARSDAAGQEHTPTTQGGIVYKGCGGHATTTSFDMYPFTGPGFYVVWAELLSADGTKVALSNDSNEASCDFEVLSQTATAITFYCKGQTIPAVPGKPTGLTATPK